MQSAFNTAFGAKTAILNTLSAKLTDMVNNPKGFDPKTLALMKTSASDTVARQTQAAQVSAGNYGASHGGVDLGSGVQAQIQGSIAGAGAEEGARESTGIDISDAQLKNENLWRGISGLTNVAQAEDPTGYAGAANSAGNTTANLGSAFLASKQADWNNAFGVVKGVAGLASAAAGLPSFAGSPATGAKNLNSPSGIGVGGDSTGWYD